MERDRSYEATSCFLVGEDERRLSSENLKF
jgi:hypothetical protein